MLLLLFFIANCILSLNFVECDEDTCGLEEEKHKIQVAFVVDITTTMKPVVAALGDTLEKTMTELNGLHPGTEFALTLFANWPDYVYNQGHKEPEGCYIRKQAFTNDPKAIKTAATNIQILPSASADGSNENSISALAFSAADKKLGWVREDADPKGGKVHRFMVVITDQWSIFSLKKPENRTKFRGDGTDTCATSLPASLEDAKKTWETNGMNIIGAYYTNQLIYKTYVREMKKIEYEERHCVSDSVLQASGGISDNLKKLVLKCVKESMNGKQCEEADPPPYNTLGL